MKYGLMLMLALLCAGYVAAANAKAPFIDYDWAVLSAADNELCLYSASLALEDSGFKVANSDSEAERVGRKGDYKAVIACLPDTILFIVSGPSYQQAKSLNAQLKAGAIGAQ